MAEGNFADFIARESERLHAEREQGNKSGEMSVSNALTALTKANQVTRTDGRYSAA